MPDGDALEKVQIGGREHAFILRCWRNTPGTSSADSKTERQSREVTSRRSMRNRISARNHSRETTDGSSCSRRLLIPRKILTARGRQIQSCILACSGGSRSFNRALYRLLLRFICLMYRSQAKDASTCLPRSHSTIHLDDMPPSKGLLRAMLSSWYVDSTAVNQEDGAYRAMMSPKDVTVPSS